MAGPKVSICIPAYKQPVYLRRTLQSIFRQTFDNYEIIITDDSPDDLVENAVKEFQSVKLNYYKNRKRKGSPNNWNEAADLATGEYIKFLHHDDWFAEENSLSEFVKMLDENPNSDFAFCSSFAFGPNEKLKFIHSPSEKQLGKLRRTPYCLFPENFIGAPSATIYRSSINKKFDTKLKWVVDIDFYIDILKDNNNFIFCSKPLICITTGTPDQMTSICSNNKNVELFEWLYLYQKIRKEQMIPSYRYLKFFWGLFKKYETKSVNELYNLRIEPPIPMEIYMIMLFLYLLGK